jgi:hypothetical protein
MERPRDELIPVIPSRTYDQIGNHAVKRYQNGDPVRQRAEEVWCLAIGVMVL